MTGAEYDERRKRREEADERVPAAMAALLEHSALVVDVLPEPKSTALRWFLRAWENVEDDDEKLWGAVVQLLSGVVEGEAFDDDLCRAVVDLLAAIAHAATESGYRDEPVSLGAYEEMRQAHEAIGAVLDRIREEETVGSAR